MKTQTAVEDKSESLHNEVDNQRKTGWWLLR